MTLSDISPWVATLLGGGLITAIVTGVIQLRKFPIDRKTARIEQTKTTVGIAIDTLNAVNAQYKDVQEKQKTLEDRVDKLQRELEDQRSLIGQFKKYISHIFDNWHEVRQQEEPPHLTDQIKLTIFKEK